MDWRRKVAREWLWFLCSIVGCSVFWFLILSIEIPLTEWLADELCNIGDGIINFTYDTWKAICKFVFKPLFPLLTRRRPYSGSHNYIEMTRFTFILPMLLLYFVRSIIWSIKQLKRKEV